MELWGEERRADGLGGGCRLDWEGALSPEFGPLILSDNALAESFAVNLLVAENSLFFLLFIKNS